MEELEGQEINQLYIFQTYDPKDEILLNIAKNDPRTFLNKELVLRKEKNYLLF